MNRLVKSAVLLFAGALGIGGVTFVWVPEQFIETACERMRPKGNSNPCVDGFFVDRRDGKRYGCRKFGTQNWMTQNLEFGAIVPGSSGQGNATHSKAQKHCPDDLEESCKREGALYQWHTAMALPMQFDHYAADGKIGSPHRGICPEGWHIPSREENEAKNEWKAQTGDVNSISVIGILTETDEMDNEDAGGSAMIWSATETVLDGSNYAVALGAETGESWQWGNRTMSLAVRCVED